MMRTAVNKLISLLPTSCTACTSTTRHCARRSAPCFPAVILDTMFSSQYLIENYMTQDEDTAAAQAEQKLSTFKFDTIHTPTTTRRFALQFSSSSTSPRSSTPRVTRHREGLVQADHQSSSTSSQPNQAVVEGKVRFYVFVHAIPGGICEGPHSSNSCSSIGDGQASRTRWTPRR